ncbi:NAD-dependent epimerase/dehydratase family protein [Clostridium estertheticum]|uniref:NAD-dependent epimerase/dehydratase family protein n=1 Tax=Clostridium estertheticum TaxID=238834 RepID=UPI0013E90198|nr:NAD-dependent epimerase/dehydratase family protein [Clostridium estertheticum]MBZ9687387.1 NAD-dependent epimerase/dehydratase family protein [Clostridium estertheticum]
MKILVMGGTEFVSSSLTKYLISKGYIVDIFTRGIKSIKYNGIRKHLKGDRKSIEDLKVNISNEKYDYIFDISAPQINLYEGLELAYKWYCSAKPDVKDAKMNKIDLVLDI